MVCMKGTGRWGISHGLGGISYGGKVGLHEGKLNGSRHLDEIVMNEIAPHINAHPDQNLILNIITSAI